MVEMESDLRSFLEDRFKDLTDKINKLEDSVVRVFDKLDGIAIQTNSNVKDIENLQEKHREIKGIIDDKLKGQRINHEACQANCKLFREDLKKLMDEKDKASEMRLKNWIMGLAISTSVMFGVSIALKFIGGK